jgi:hypothetical protein
MKKVIAFAKWFLGCIWWFFIAGLFSWSFLWMFREAIRIFLLGE